MVGADRARASESSGSRSMSAAQRAAQRSSVALEVTELTIHFGGLVAIDALSFEVRVGEVLSLIGPNGAGKTTAFNAITGYLSPTAGEIRFRGTRLNGLKPNR